jgi:hypothetical protein
MGLARGGDELALQRFREARTIIDQEEALLVARLRAQTKQSSRTPHLRAIAA